MLKQFFQGVLSKRRKRRLLAQSPTEVFSGVYGGNKWGGKESRSGKGSDLDATRNLITAIPDMCRRYGVSSMLDVPCGDFNWMQHADLTGIRYRGADIVPDLIAANQLAYSTPNISFEVCDLIEGPVPQADLLHVRDCLVHLSEEHILSALRNIRASNATYLLSTTFPDVQENAKILTGEWRALNLQKPPFNFPEPIDFIQELHAGKRLALWKIADLPEL